MVRIPPVPKFLRFLAKADNQRPVSLAAERFLQVFRDHGVEPAQIPRLFPEVKLDDLQSLDRLLAILTPNLIDQVAKLFGVRSEWLEGCGDRIYDYLAAYKEPRILLDHLRRLIQQPSWANEVGTPLRVLATTKNLDFRNTDRYELAPILIEPIAKLGDETIYRFHIYQDGFSWDHQPARIELKAIVRTAYKALGKPIPLYVVTQRDMDELLEGRRIPRPHLRHALITNPSLEDFVLDRSESGVAKEWDEVPAVLDYIARTGLDTYDFLAKETDTEQEVGSTPSTGATPTVSTTTPSKPKSGKQGVREDNWKNIRAAASAIWASEPLTIADMVRRLKRVPSLKATMLENTIHKHIADLAPEGIRGKPGRKAKKSP